MMKMGETVIDHTETGWGVEYTDKTWGNTRIFEVEDETMAYAYASLLDGKVKTQLIYVGQWVDAK